MKVEFRGFGEAEEKLRTALMDIARKCSDGILEIGCNDYYDLAMAIATVRHCSEVFLAADLLPVLTITIGQKDNEDVVGMAVLFKAFGLAVEHLEACDPTTSAEGWRKKLWDMALAEFNGKTGAEMAQSIARHYPEVKISDEF